MARKADVKGGNGDVVFDAETGTARKYLRNTSTAEKVTRFKRELAVFQELCKNPIPNVVEVTDVYIDEDKIAESYVEIRKNMTVRCTPTIYSSYQSSEMSNSLVFANCFCQVI